MARAISKPSQAFCNVCKYTSRAFSISAYQGNKGLSNPDLGERSKTVQFEKSTDPYTLTTYARPDLVFVRGKGAYLWDLDDRKFIDFTAGIAVTALGHSNEEVAKILAEQAQTLVHVSNLYRNEWTGKLAKRLVNATKSSGAMASAAEVFVCNSGTEANEAALKFARKWGQVKGDKGKTEIVSFTKCFHGRTFGTLSATHNPKYQKPFAPLVPGFIEAEYNNIEGLKTAINDKTCGVIIEPVQGEGGVYPASIEFLKAVRERCNEVGAVLIFDEIQCGLGRSGTFWAHQFLEPKYHPDIVTMAKALGNGVPIGATMVSKEVADVVKIGDHGTTFGGNPLCCRVADYVVSVLSDKSFLKEVEAKSARFNSGFEKLRAKYPDIVTEARGRGLLLGLQLTVDPVPIIKAARERGLLVISAGTNTLRFVPALNIPDEAIDQGLEILDAAIGSQK